MDNFWMFCIHNTIAKSNRHLAIEPRHGFATYITSYILHDSAEKEMLI